MAGDRAEAAPLAAAGAGRGILLWAAQAPLGAALQAVLQGQYSVTLLEALPAALPEAAGAVVLLARSPAEALCAGLQDGLAPAAALAAAQQEIETVLALQVQNRQRVLLLDGAAARQAPEALLACCGPAAADAAQRSLQDAAGAAPDAVLLALAAARLQADPGLRRLAGQFAASVQAGQAGQAAADPDAALKIFLAGQDAAEERALLQAQQHSMYEQMEALYREKLQLERQLEQAGGRFTSLQAQAEAARAQLQAETEALKGRLRAKAELLGTAGHRIAGLEQVAAAQAQTAAGLKAQVQKLRNSRSFRLMAPLRSARHALRGTR
ncbi:hypothetical protein [Leisingera aquimarina]|uniref:hypothetical protein n=1 Tax=Leisingera aquimarina TaxID=476529 RepID=UPI000410571A|nr:hypothetical protein [Leisingera aquimarina]